MLTTPALLTPTELAAQLRVCSRTVARWVLDGCPFEWVGARRRFNLDAVRAWNQERSQCRSEETPKAAGTRMSAINVGGYTDACRRVQLRVMPGASNPN
jgi:excisionase family DNA binding protein